jgi:hypothetical protein
VAGGSPEYADSSTRRHLIRFALLGDASNFSVNYGIEWKMRMRY